jgi:oxygen-independent coproporphyrinogen-3 oxidase
MPENFALEGARTIEPSDERDLPRWLWPRAAYVHIPFCAHHCGYCDFAVVAGADDRIDTYLDSLEREFAMLGEPRRVETIFIGGGTPTYLSAGQLERLLTAIATWFPPARRASEGGTTSLACPSGWSECSIESTPESLTADKVTVLADHGVNRVSIGVQSFDARTLAVLERIHSPDDVPRAIEIVRRRIGNVSLDLIFGVPGQTLTDWDNDLTRAIACAPDHISTYGLTYESGTRLWKQRRSGLVRALDEDTELAMYLHALDTLAAAGLPQYEVSNHARPGRECRHNRTYWANQAYWGFGVGAARYVHGRRELNTRSLPEYLKRLRAGESATAQSEELGAEERARETISVQLRRAEGIDRAGFAEQTGFDLDTLAGEVIARHAGAGLMADDAKRVRLTRRGFCVADSLIADFF